MHNKERVYLLHRDLSKFENSKVYLFILFIDFDDYVRAVEGATATLSCPAGNIIVQVEYIIKNNHLFVNAI
jgi:hypothetical protein